VNEEVLLKTKLIALVVPATLALAAGGMVAAYAATPTPPAPANSQAAEQAETGAAEKAEAPEAPGAPEVGHADDPKDANADHQFEGQE
jgi:hypothetical protein